MQLTTNSGQQFGLGFIAGYCDTVGFIALGGLFVAHVTGNFVLAGASVLSFDGDNVVPNLLMLPVFLLIIGLLTLASKHTRFQALTVDGRTRVLLAFQLVFSLAFWAVGALVSTQHLPVHGVGPVFAVGALGVTALAAQNALTRLTGENAPATTVMTGNITQAAVSTFALLALRGDADPAKRQAERAQLNALAPSVAGFFVGAAAAAPLTYLLHFHSMAVACVALALMLWTVGRRQVGQPGR